MFAQTTGLVTLMLISIGVFNVYAFHIENDLIFRLYTREFPADHAAIIVNGSVSISAITFNPNRPTRIFVHGFKSKDKVINRYKDAYLGLGDFNFIAVDWTKGANTYNYFAAKSYVQPISAQLAQFIDALVARGMNLKDVTMVGHSLGAHIAGLAARQLKSGGKVACIIALDPAAVGFDINEREKRLTESDADYVQVIHTDGDNFGFIQPLGHADMYPNGGKLQPGCPILYGIFSLLEKCSHVRAHYYFLESLTSNFTAIQCVSHTEIQDKQCTTIPFNNATALMGGDITSNSPQPHGIFYLETNPSAPFSIPDYHSYNLNKLNVTEHQTPMILPQI